MIPHFTKQILTDILLFSGGFSAIASMVILVVVYFRLTRKYDAMFPGYYRISAAGTSLLGNIHRTGAYAKLIVFRNKSKRIKHIKEITGGYDFRGNAPTLDIVLSHLLLFLAIYAIISATIVFIMTRILGIEL